jgi:hypothetical protein
VQEHDIALGSVGIGLCGRRESVCADEGCVDVVQYVGLDFTDVCNGEGQTKSKENAWRCEDHVL